MINITNFNRLNHGDNYNPHKQYDYIAPVKLSLDEKGGDMLTKSPNLWLKMWEFNLSSDYVEKSLRTFYMSFDIIDLLTGNNQSSINFKIALTYKYGELQETLSKRYNSIDYDSSEPLDDINIHLFYQKNDNFYKIKIYLKHEPGVMPMAYNARFFNMRGYDKLDKQFYPSFALTNGSYLQITRYFMNTIGRKWYSDEEMLMDTDGFQHEVAEVDDYEVGWNLLKGTKNFASDNWQMPGAGYSYAVKNIDDFTFFNVQSANIIPININQQITLITDHHYSFTFAAKVNKPTFIKFEMYAIGKDQSSYGISYMKTFYVDNKMRRYMIDFRGNGNLIQHFCIKPTSLDNVDGLWQGAYTLNYVPFDSHWRSYAE